MQNFWSIEQHERLSSTQDVLKARASEDASEGLVIQAAAQTKGRGRHGRSWEAGAGNLYLSLFLRPQCQVSEIGALSLMTGAAIAQSLEPFVKRGAEIRLKWPNDVMLNALKCAGVLIEVNSQPGGQMNWAAIGIGVNIACAPIEASTCLNDNASKDIPLQEFRDHLLDQIKNLYMQWTSVGFAPMKEAWLDYAYPADTQMSVKVGHDMVQGHFAGLDEAGNLVLKMQDGTRKTIYAGDVYLD